MAICPSCVRPLTFFFPFLHQSGPNLHEVFISDEYDGERNPPSNPRVIGPEILKIAVFNLASAIEPTFLNQTGPKLHKVFIGTRSRTSSIMREIRRVRQEFLALKD